MINIFAKLNPNDFNVPQPSNGLDNGAIGTVLNIVFSIAAGVAIIIIILAGLKYVTSRGDPTGVAKAKNTIIYAVIGLAVSVAAFGIVSFVADKI